MYLYEYENLAEARIWIGHFLDNEQRLTLDLGYVPLLEIIGWSSYLHLEMQ